MLVARHQKIAAKIEHQRSLLENLARKLKIITLDDWYNVTTVEITNIGGRGFDLLKGLQTVYPEHDWKPWKFKYVSWGYWNDSSTHRQYFDWLGKQLNVTQPEHWYRATLADVHNTGGAGLLILHYSGSLTRALMAIYPEYNLQGWKFHQVPPGYWEEKDNLRMYLDWLGKELGILSFDDWYTQKWTDLPPSTPQVLRHHGNSLGTALALAYPEHAWLPWKFPQVPSGFWDSTDNHRVYFHWLAKELDIKTEEDWYKLKQSDVKNKGGGGLIVLHYGGSMFRALSTIFPEHKWQPWRFDVTPAGFWDDIDNQRRFFEWLGSELNIHQLDDWYNIIPADVLNKGGGGILYYYNESLQRALTSVYPAHKWKTELFKYQRQDCITQHHRKFFDGLAKKLQLTGLDGWYDVKQSVLLEHGAGPILRQYGTSMLSVFTNLYPEHKWYAWRFLKVAPGYWKDSTNAVTFLHWMGDRLGITNLEDWYYVTHKTFHLWGAAGLLKGRSPMHLLKKVYPEHHWDSSREVDDKTQALMLLIVREIFPGEQLYNNYKPAKMVYARTKQPMELDIFIPAHSIAFEYQGEQHYKYHHLYGAASIWQQKDHEKKSACHKAGITLVEVPFWWDHSRESLIATIHQLRPDLIPDPGHGQPILRTYPHHYNTI